MGAKASTVPVYAAENTPARYESNERVVKIVLDADKNSKTASVEA